MSPGPASTSGPNSARHRSDGAHTLQDTLNIGQPERGQAAQQLGSPVEPGSGSLARPSHAIWSPQRLGSIAIGSAVAAWVGLVAVQASQTGFYSDDWMIRGLWTFSGYGGAVDAMSDSFGDRPLLSAALPAPYAIFGTNPVWHHLVAALYVGLTVASFYAVLRQLRFARRDAAPIAVLALLFPWASGVRIWPTSSANNLAALFLFIGLLVALRGLRTCGWKGVLIHTVAAACYAASVLTYELAAPLAVMLWPAYVWRADWRRSRSRVVMDLAAVGGASLYSLATKRSAGSQVHDLSSLIHRFALTLIDGVRLLTAALLPIDRPYAISRVLAGGFAVAVLSLLAIAAGRRLRRASGLQAANELLRHWLTVSAVAVAALALSWLLYLPLTSTPATGGTGSRINVLALYPAVVLVYALLRAVGCLVSRQGYRLAVAGCVALSFAYLGQALREERDWARAGRLQQPVLAAVQRASPADRSLVLVFGFPAEVAPGIPVFHSYWDLYHAAQIRTANPTISTYSVFVGARLACTNRGLTIAHLPTTVDGGTIIDPRQNGTPLTVSYPGVVVIDMASRRDTTLRNQMQCQRVVREIRKGPLRSTSIAASAKVDGTQG